MTKRIKQEYKENEQGARQAVCPYCKEVIVYPFGVYFRNGIEVHTSCITVLRMRSGKIEGIDFNSKG
jgi:hypothetical protein